MGDTGHVSINQKPRKYGASIADTDTDTITNTFHLKGHDHWLILLILPYFVDYDPGKTQGKDFGQINFFSNWLTTIQNNFI